MGTKFVECEAERNDESLSTALDSQPLDGRSHEIELDETKRRVVAYFDASNRDYGVWSRDYNMHFGYWRRGVAWWRLEPMLSEMSRQILERLNVDSQARLRLVDLGGGVGAAARTIARLCPQATIDVVTIVPSQIELGEELNRRAGLDDRIHMVHADYVDTGLDSQTYDGAWALESACQSADPSKAQLLAEAYRLLGETGRFVMADGAVRRTEPRGLTGKVYRYWCRCWAIDQLPNLARVPDAARDAGFQSTTMEDWSWRVFPSVFHIPIKLLKFAACQRLDFFRLTHSRRKHLAGCALSIPLACRLDLFAYAAMTFCKVNGTRRVL